jgi:hypothetical protein
VLVVLAGLLSVALPGSLAADTQPVLSPIHAVFVEAEKATHYTVTITPASSPVYVWTFKAPPDDPNCRNVVKGATPNELIWKHSAADGCMHNSPSHDGTIGVVVTQGDWVCQATIVGTLDHDGPTPGPCVSRTGTAPPTSTGTSTTPGPPVLHKPQEKPGPCHCTALTAAIDPSSIGLYGPHVLKRFHMEFTVDWTLTCARGTSGCHARFVVSPPAGATYFRPAGGEIKCDGPCGKKLTGKKTFTIFGGVSLDHKHRAGKTITLQVERFCQGRKLIVPQSFEIVFNSQGFVDKKKSGFVAKTR